MKKIITPVGLSLIHNFFKGKEKGGGNCRGLESFYETLKEGGSATNYNDRDINTARINLKPGILNWAKSQKNACAEFTSIQKIEEESNNENFDVYLFPSDTVLSKFVAELIAEREIWQNHFSKVQNVFLEPHIEGLQTEKENEFIQKGMKSLISRIEDLLKLVQDPQHELLINITGGYKATIPYLTIWGQVYNIQLVYTFEDDSTKNNQLIKIPRAPVDFDFTLLDDYYDIIKFLKEKDSVHIDELKQELYKQRIKIKQKDLDLLFKNDILQQVNDQIKISLIGGILFRHYQSLRSKGIRNAFLNLFGNVIELKIFKYYSESYPNQKVEHGVTFQDAGRKVLEIDVLVKAEKEIIAVEVKPLSRFEEIKTKFDENKFDYLLKTFTDKSIILHLILYGNPEMSDIVKELIDEIHKKNQSKFKEVVWKRLDLSIGNPKNDIHWKVDKNKLKDS